MSGGKLSTGENYKRGEKSLGRKLNTRKKVIDKSDR